MKKAQPGERYHFLVSGIPYLEATTGGLGVISVRGGELVVTEDLVAANTDRNGACWLDLLHDPAAQEARWGQQIAAPGPFPDGALRSDPGSPERVDEARAAVRAARSIPDKAERLAAVREVEALYGPVPPTSRTIAEYAGD